MGDVGKDPQLPNSRTFQVIFHFYGQKEDTKQMFLL